MAVLKAKEAGLRSAGLMDHDSIAGANEFIEAGRIAGLPITIGLECRADFSKTALNGKYINHPDQRSVAYIALHGIPHNRFKETADFFAPSIEARNRRNQAMVTKINLVLNPLDLFIDYINDVLPLSQHDHGGTVTERHLLYAVTLKLIQKFGKGEGLIKIIEEKLNIMLSNKMKSLLQDRVNPFYEYDLLGILKSGLGNTFYIDAKEECYPIETIVDFSYKIGAILAYAYLGDIEESVTGDKKAQHFEDAYLELLFNEIKRLKFQAVTYMPTRNTKAQLARIRSLCKQNGLLEISGEDINSPRQSFICPALSQPEYSHLVDMTWALIGHELEATRDASYGFFTPETKKRFPGLDERIMHFKSIGQKLQSNDLSNRSIK